MHLFHSRQTGNKISAKDILPNLSYFTRFAVAVPNYNSSLHGVYFSSVFRLFHSSERMEY